MKKVAVNSFVKRQIKGSGKTYSETLSFEEIALDAQEQMDKNHFDEGYRDGVRIVRASSKNIKHFMSADHKNVLFRSMSGPSNIMLKIRNRSYNIMLTL